VQVFYPTEEEFKDFYAYAQKLDRLVGHIGVCKVVPPKGWKARPHDLYTLQDSSANLEESLQVKKPIRQNAIGGKGLYANVHEVKRSMKLADFKKAAMSKEFAPPIDGQFKELTDDDVDQLERRFWRNVLFNPPMYGADCPAPTGLRSDGKEGLFDPLTCGDWDLAKLPSLLTHGIKKRVPGVNTPFLYIGMYRAAFAWHCEDMANILKSTPCSNFYLVLQCFRALILRTLVRTCTRSTTFTGARPRRGTLCPQRTTPSWRSSRASSSPCSPASAKNFCGTRV
jgi:jumonji domain-containing protein 2